MAEHTSTQAFVDALLAKNRALYGSLRMEDPPEGGDKGADADKAKADKADDKTGAADDKSAKDDLGDAGQRALVAERNRAKEAEKRAKAAERALEDERRKGMSDQDKVLDEARRDERTKVTQAYADRIVKAEVRAAAGGKLADPEDAVRLLDLAQFELGEDLALDSAKVTRAVEDLLKSKPYLAAVAKSTKTAAPGRPVEQLRPGGAPDAPPAKTNLTEAITARYTANS